jgi:hypothetical protein
MHIETKREKSSFLSKMLYRLTYKLDFDDVVTKSRNYEDRKKELHKLIIKKNDKPVIIQESISTHIDNWEEFKIKHIYADMHTFISSIKIIEELDFIDKIVYYPNISGYHVYEKDKNTSVATIVIDDFCITLTAWEISDGKAVDILTVCLHEIIKFQDKTTEIL